MSHRNVVLGVLVGLFALTAGVASAASRVVYYYGQARVGKVVGPVEFKRTGQRLEIVYGNLGPATCAFTVADIPMRIDHGRFHKVKRFSNGALLTVNGKVVSAKKLTGTMVGSSPNCSTGTMHFAALRQQGPG